MRDRNFLTKQEEGAGSDAFQMRFANVIEEILFPKNQEEIKLLAFSRHRGVIFSQDSEGSHSASQYFRNAP